MNKNKLLKKEWSPGPFNTPYPKSPPLNCESDITLPKKNIIPKDPIKNKRIPWKQASVKSHELFIWESQKLTII
jgi:hypothetical protein